MRSEFSREPDVSDGQSVRYRRWDAAEDDGWGDADGGVQSEHTGDATGHRPALTSEEVSQHASWAGAGPVDHGQLPGSTGGIDERQLMREPVGERAALAGKPERGPETVKRAAERVQRDEELVSRFQAASRLNRSLPGAPAHLTAESATPAERELARGYGQVAGKPGNSKYAGRRFPLEEKNAALAAKYPDSVQFDAQGFPDFSPYAVANVILPQLPGDRSKDFGEADTRTGWDDRSRSQAGLTWHHHQDGKTLLLVPTDLHQAVGHHGGIAHETRVAGPQRLITNYLINSMHELLEPEGDD